MGNVQDEVLEAICRVCDRNGNARFTRDQLIHTEMETIVTVSGSDAEHPEMSVSFRLTGLVKSGFIKRIDHGEYELKKLGIIWLDMFRKKWRHMENGLSEDEAMKRVVDEMTR